MLPAASLSLVGIASLEWSEGILLRSADIMGNACYTGGATVSMELTKGSEACKDAVTFSVVDVGDGSEAVKYEALVRRVLGRRGAVEPRVVTDCVPIVHSYMQPLQLLKSACVCKDWTEIAARESSSACGSTLECSSPVHASSREAFTPSRLPSSAARRASRRARRAARRVAWRPTGRAS